MNIFLINNLLNLSLYLIFVSILIFIFAVIYRYSDFYRKIEGKRKKNIKKMLNFVGRICVALFSFALILFSLGYYLNEHYLFTFLSPFLFIIGLSIFFGNLSYKSKIGLDKYNLSQSDKKIENIFKDTADKDFENIKKITDIIVDKKVDKATIEIISQLLDRYHFHAKNAYKAQMKYRFFGYFFSIGTIVLGVIVAVIPFIDIPLLSVLIGAIVAMIGPINSAYKFSSNFESCAKALIELHNWSLKFAIDLQKALNDNLNTLDKLSSFLLQKDQEISAIGAKLPSIMMPSLSESIEEIKEKIKEEIKEEIKNASK